MPAESTSILWKRLDRAGHEFARIFRKPTGWELAGAAVFAHEGEACRLDYSITCDSLWRTRSALIAGWVGEKSIRSTIEVSTDGVWRLNDRDSRAVDGCIDLDLNFSPSTNTLPIRRLSLAVDEEAAVRAAWLRFPSFTLEPLEQRYRRTGDDSYRYESAGGQFVAGLRVGPAGLVTEYGDIWVAEPG